MQQKHKSAPAPQRVQVLERWNQWVRVRFETSGAETWVNLAETPFAPIAQEEAQKKSKNFPPDRTLPSDSDA
ncbi:MAG: hypothetical protein R3F17_05250 [Planctomycetota bacterium]